MEMLPVKPTQNCTRKKHTKNKLKVVYISSPMKVKTSVSRFRSLVQELTGRDSDISRYNVDRNCFDPVAPALTPTTSPQGEKAVESCDEKGMHFTGSESLLDDVFGVEQLEGMFPSYSLYESWLQ
ncbi:uncharacterized protein LOC111914601 [Lactuca sativa]|uniref:uncharacterized protein LOC111914601 n=1 Tax=Lactuca sativa TaxID=4236 RepID=UPI000CD9824A|nr:uncharacterized protein LOC111914601 [Lactuca sativa]